MKLWPFKLKSHFFRHIHPADAELFNINIIYVPKFGVCVVAIFTKYMEIGSLLITINIKIKKYFA